MGRSITLKKDEVYSSTTRKYLLGLTLIACLSFLAYLTMHKAIDTQQHLASIINISGRQRMLSQRIALDLELLTSRGTLSKVDVLEDLVKGTDLFETSHEILSKGSPEIGNPIPEVLEVYFGSENHLDLEAREFISTVRHILKSPQHVLEEDQSADRVRIRSLTFQSLIPKLNSVVVLYQKHSEHQVARLHSIETSILGFTIFLLLLEALFIFRPMTKKITSLLNTAIEAKSAAVEATIAKSAFLATITHEIRTPLTGVSGIAEHLLDSNLDKNQREQLETVSRLSDTLISLINDILDYSKIETGKLTVEEVDFDLETLMKDTQLLFNASAQGKNVELTTDTDARLPTRLVGDPVRLRQVITNFVGNSLKFTPSKGRISVQAILGISKSTDEKIPLRIEVHDTGVGIPTASQSKIFQRYMQADDSITRKYGGTGLGLSICKQIVETMGGIIGFASHENKGSVFWFEIELSPSKKQIAAIEPSASPTLFQNTKVLLVEDNEVNRKVLTLQLRKLGLQVVPASDGIEAVALVETTDFDLILMDCEMSKKDGFAATLEIRNFEVLNPRPATPIIAMTGYEGEEMKAKCLAAGMNDFITKPVKNSLLAESISKFLSTKQIIKNAA